MNRLRQWWRRGDPVQGRSAVIVPVPAAAAALDAWGLPPAGLGTAPGMPPHVTLLYPFVPQAQLDAATVAELRRIVATTSAFEFALTDLGRFPGVLYLAPEPAGPFVALTRAIVERWPEHPPYDGAYDTIVPHLTIVGGREPPSLVVDIEPTLPVLACASEVWVMVEGAGGTWTRHARLPLGSPCA